MLSLFARVANIPDVDPTRMVRHRRASSTSSSDSARSPPRDIVGRSRSSSRTSLQRRVGSVGSFEGFQASRWAERVPLPEHE